MKNIKFRAWNKKYKEMYSWEELLDPMENEIREWVNKAYHHLYISLFQAIITKKDVAYNYKLMQFTWLYDKNWDEIYEGDIVEAFDWIEAFTWEVKYDVKYLQFALFNKIWKLSLWTIDRELLIKWNIYE